MKKEREDSLNFEESLQELENIALAMGAGKLSLEQCVEMYQKGKLLIKKCEKCIEKAKVAVETIEG